MVRLTLLLDSVFSKPMVLREILQDLSSLLRTFTVDEGAEEGVPVDEDSTYSLTSARSDTYVRNDKDHARRVDLVQSLASSPDVNKAVPILLHSLKHDPSPNVRLASAISLETLGLNSEKTVSGMLEAYLTESGCHEACGLSETFRMRLIESFSYLGYHARAALPVLLHSREHQPERVRDEINKAVPRIRFGVEWKLPELMNDLRGPSEPKRIEAITSLGMLGATGAFPQEAVGKLTALLKDPSEAVAAQAAWALGQIGFNAGSSVPSLVSVLEKSPRLGAPVRKQATLALGQIGTDAHIVVPLLTAILEDTRESPDVREAAAEGLGRFGYQAKLALPHLRKALEREFSRAASGTIIEAMHNISREMKIIGVNERDEIDVAEVGETEDIVSDGPSCDSPSTLSLELKDSEAQTAQWLLKPKDVDALYRTGLFYKQALEGLLKRGNVTHALTITLIVERICAFKPEETMESREVSRRLLPKILKKAELSPEEKKLAGQFLHDGMADVFRSGLDMDSRHAGHNFEMGRANEQWTLESSGGTDLASRAFLREAVHYYTHAAGLDSQFVEGWLKAGRLLKNVCLEKKTFCESEENGDLLSEAAGYFRKYLETNPDHQETLQALAELQIFETRHQEQEQKQKGWMRDKVVNRLFDAALLLQKEGADPAQIERNYTIALNLDPENLDGHYFFGQFLERQGRHEEASGHYLAIPKTAVDDGSGMNPTYADAQCALGRLSLTEKNYPRAIDYFQTALEADPGHEETNYSLGLTFHLMGSPEDAQNFYETTLSLNPHHGKAHSNLGLLFQNQQNREKAVHHYHCALQSDPEDDVASFGLKELHLQPGNGDEDCREKIGDEN